MDADIGLLRGAGARGARVDDVAKTIRAAARGVGQRAPRAKNSSGSRRPPASEKGSIRRKAIRESAGWNAMLGSGKAAGKGERSGKAKENWSMAFRREGGGGPVLVRK